MKKWHRANMYDALRYISKYYKVTNGSAAFDTLQAPISHNRVYYTCIHKLITFDFITINYTTMPHCVGIYYGTVAFYRDLTRIIVSDIKSKWIWHHSNRNNIRKNDTGLTGTMHYNIFRSITWLQTFLLHSIHCKHQFLILQYIKYVYTN